MTVDQDRTAMTDGGGRNNAYRRFQQLLLSGRLRAGEVISQRELVALLDVSLGTLRELLPRLQAEGLLTVLPQRGIQITTVDLAMIRNAYQLRLALEREAVIGAVRRGRAEDIDRQIALHRGILDRAAAGIDESLLREAQEIDTGMHVFLVEATGNDLLIQAYGVNSIRVRLINVHRMRLNPQVLHHAFGDHLEILQAIRARDEARAVAALERHIDSARSRAVAF